MTREAAALGLVQQGTRTLTGRPDKAFESNGATDTTPSGEHTHLGGRFHFREVPPPMVHDILAVDENNPGEGVDEAAPVQPQAKQRDV